MAGREAISPVDTGFIVFNYSQLPQYLAATVQRNWTRARWLNPNMSFGAPLTARRAEYGPMTLEIRILVAPAAQCT